MIETHETAHNQPSPGPLRILLVEDNEHDALIFRRALLKSTITVEISHYVRAEEALAKLQQDAFLFDIVVTDYKLPGMSGLELCKELLVAKITLPLVILTGAGTEHLAVEALNAGVDDYLIKDTGQGYLDLLPIVLPQMVHRYHDSMARRQAEESLRRYAAELESRNKELDAFAHTVAHDLKNPLGLILGYIQVIQENTADLTAEEVQLSLQGVARSGERMRNIINALMLLAGVRKREVSLTPLNMVAITHEVQQRLTNMINNYQAEIILPATWPLALGYTPWIEEVWINYLSNALKYGGKPPYIEFGANQQSNGMIRFWLRDNGPGLTPEERDQLFVPFIRLNQIRIEGHGLGLSIVQRIIKKLGGQVGVTTWENKPDTKPTLNPGSEFWFTLPAVSR